MSREDFPDGTAIAAQALNDWAWFWFCRYPMLPLNVRSSRLPR